MLIINTISIHKTYEGTKKQGKAISYISNSETHPLHQQPGHPRAFSPGQRSVPVRGCQVEPGCVSQRHSLS